MVLVKIWQCWHLLIQSKIGQESAFYDILEKKNAFLEYKNKKSEKSKILEKKTPFCDIKTRRPKSRKIGIIPWFWSNFGNDDIF